MKRKIKKYLFHLNEVNQLRNLLHSSDEECKNLAIEMIINSKTYKHYLKRRLPPELIRWINAHNGQSQIIKLISDHSHERYKK